jgi:hypothetical protein
MNATVQTSWDLDPGTAGQLFQAVDRLHASTRRPRHEILTAIIQAGLASQEAIETRLAELHLDAVLTALPSAARPVPDLLAYDQLLTRQDPRT